MTYKLCKMEQLRNALPRMCLAEEPRKNQYRIRERKMKTEVRTENLRDDERWPHRMFGRLVARSLRGKLTAKNVQREELKLHMIYGKNEKVFLFCLTPKDSEAHLQLCPRGVCHGLHEQRPASEAVPQHPLHFRTVHAPQDTVRNGGSPPGALDGLVWILRSKREYEQSARNVARSDCQTLI